MPPHDYSLQTAPRLDPEALCTPLRDVGIECDRTRIDRLGGHRQGARFSQDSTSVRLMLLRSLTRLRPESIKE